MRCIFQIEDAIAGRKLTACQSKYANYIEEIIKILHTKLPMKLIITLEALMILEVHGELVISNTRTLE